MQSSSVQNKVETPVVAFPLRGRVNPYWWYLLPLLLFSIAAFVLTILALIAASIAPANQELFDQNMWVSIKGARIVGIIMYSIVLVLTGFLFMFYVANLFNLFDSKYIQIALNALILTSAFLLFPISVLLVVSENDAKNIQGYNQSSLLVAGILGLSSLGTLIGALFFSRFYEYCIGIYKNKKRELIMASELTKVINEKFPKFSQGV